MTSKRSIPLAALCGLALVVAGCGGGDDNGALSYDDTGTEISAICESVDTEGLTGRPANDAPILEQAIPDFEQGIEDLRALEVDEELEADRDAFADNADQQLEIIREAQVAAESGNAGEYRETATQIQPLDRESNEIASRLGASGCID